MFFERPTSARPTEGSESLSWPTPQSYSRGKSSNSAPGLTPLDIRARGMYRWATPNASDAAHGGGKRKTGTTTQAIASHRDRKQSTDGLVLNPQFVEALMGFPDGWTALDASEMPLSQRKRRSRGNG
jgi:hypothetical protein